MKLVVVSVYDRAAGAYGRPIFVPSVGAALRSFQDEVNRKAEDNTMYQHPEDFELFQLAEFDDVEGRFNGLQEPKALAYGRTVKLA